MLLFCDFSDVGYTGGDTAGDVTLAETVKSVWKLPDILQTHTLFTHKHL